MPMNTGQRERNHLFDIIKAACALTVVVTHLHWGKEIRRNFVFYGMVDMAVPMYMLISCYLRARKRKCLGFREYISWGNTGRSLLTLGIAYGITAAVEMLAAVLIRFVRPSIQYAFLNSFGAWLKWLLTGLSGPGSYYVPVMVQLIVYFPLVYEWFRRDRTLGLAVCAVLNLLYEQGAYFLGMPPELHRLLIFRYTLLIGFGIYLAEIRMDSREDRRAAVFFLLGLTAVVFNGSYWQTALYGEWRTTSMLCAPYAYALLYALLRFCSGAQCPALEPLGKASYHIYLTQMVFFCFGGDDFLARLFPLHTGPISRALQILLAMLLCCPAGLLFSRLESAIQQKVRTAAAPQRTEGRERLDSK